MALVWLVLISVLHFSLQQPQDRRPKLKVGYLPITCHLLLSVAMERQAFFQQSIIPVKFTSWPDMIESLKGGELDAAFILAPIAISLMYQDVPVEIALLGHRNGTGLVVSKSESIKKVEDLANKTLAIPIRFSMQNLALLSLLDAAHVDIETVTRVELPPPDMPSALASHAIDGYIVGEPYATQAELIGAGTVLKDASSIWPNFISSVVIVRKDTLKDHRSMVDRFLKGLFAQGKWIEANRIEAAQIGARFFGLDSRLIRQVLLKKKVKYINIFPKAEEFEQIGKKMVKYRLIDHLPSIGIYAKWQ